MHLAVVVLVERTEVANLRALAAVDALVLVPVDLPVGFGIDQAGAGLIPSFLPPVLRRVLRRDGDGQKVRYIAIEADGYKTDSSL